jgi:hypothetical protein
VWAITRPNTAAVAASTPAPTPEPPADTTPAAQPPTPAPPPVEAPKAYSISVRPKEASVEVDGKAAKLKNGELWLEGAIGKVFLVRVFQGVSEMEGEVVISSVGPRPNVIELEIGKKVKFTAPAPGPAPEKPGTQPPKPSTGSGAPVPFDDDEGDFKKKGK